MTERQCQCSPQRSAVPSVSAIAYKVSWMIVSVALILMVWTDGSGPLWADWALTVVWVAVFLIELVSTVKGIRGVLQGPGDRG